jgi:hypothetical protein
MPGMHSVMSVPSTALTPLNTSPKLWFDAADTSTITTTTESIVSSWTSKGTIPSISLANTYYSGGQSGVSTLNGENVISIPDYSYNSNTLTYSDPVSSNNPWDSYYHGSIISLFVVAKANGYGSGGTQALFAIGDYSPNEGDAAGLSFLFGNSNALFSVLDTNDPITIILDNSVDFTTTWRLYSLTFDGTNLKVYQNGILYKHYLYISTRVGLTQYVIDGFLNAAEIVAYNYTNETLRTNIESYLKTKWGL